MTRCPRDHCGGWLAADHDDGRVTLACALCGRVARVLADARLAAYDRDKALVVPGERHAPGPRGAHT